MENLFWSKLFSSKIKFFGDPGGGGKREKSKFPVFHSTQTPPLIVLGLISNHHESIFPPKETHNIKVYEVEI